MNRHRQRSWQRLSIFISLILVITLGLTGISYGAWNDTVTMDVSVDTAKFEPQIEIYKIERIREWCGSPLETFYPCRPLSPDVNGVIKVSIGRRSDDPIPWWNPALFNDEYKIYYRIVNNSTIPVSYSAVSQNLTPEQASYVNVLPQDQVLIGAGNTVDNNYVSLKIKYQPEIVWKGKVTQAEVNPFDLKLFGFLHLDKTFAKVMVKQFNTTQQDSGWYKNVEIRLITNDLFI